MAGWHRLLHLLIMAGPLRLPSAALYTCMLPYTRVCCKPKLRSSHAHALNRWWQPEAPCPSPSPPDLLRQIHFCGPQGVP